MRVVQPNKWSENRQKNLEKFFIQPAVSLAMIESQKNDGDHPIAANICYLMRFESRALDGRINYKSETNECCRIG